MDSHFLQFPLSDKRFDNLTTDEYLDKMRVVADEFAPPEMREQAKEDLLNAHLRLIQKRISKMLESARIKGGYSGPNRGIGIDDPSDLLISMAGHIHEQLTEIAVESKEGGFTLSSAIICRVTRGLISKWRHATSKGQAAKTNLLKVVSGQVSTDTADDESVRKQTAKYESQTDVDKVPDVDMTLDELERMIETEAFVERSAAFAEIKKHAANEFSGTQALVMEAVIYGIETDQDLPLAQIAKQLGIPRTTAQSACDRSYEILKKRFCENDPSNSG